MLGNTETSSYTYNFEEKGIFPTDVSISSQLVLNMLLLLLHSAKAETPADIDEEGKVVVVSACLGCDASTLANR
ncbi:hypothetical protein STEG23_033217 [Scotinomys teguina]